MSDQSNDEKTDYKEEILHLKKIACIECGKPTILKVMKNSSHEVPKCWPCQKGVPSD